MVASLEGTLEFWRHTRGVIVVPSGSDTGASTGVVRSEPKSHHGASAVVTSAGRFLGGRVLANERVANTAASSDVDPACLKNLCFNSSDAEGLRSGSRVRHCATKSRKAGE